MVVQLDLSSGGLGQMIYVDDMTQGLHKFHHNIDTEIPFSLCFTIVIFEGCKKMLILNMCPFVKLYHSSPGIRKLLLTNQNPLAFNSCSLTYHFTRLILSFQIGSNNISIFMGIMNKTLLFEVQIRSK